MAFVQIELTDSFDDWRLKDNELQRVINFNPDTDSDSETVGPTNVLAYEDGRIDPVLTVDPNAQKGLVDVINWNYETIGTPEDLTVHPVGQPSTNFTDLVSAINEHETEIGALEIMNAGNIEAETLVDALVEIDSELGRVEDLDPAFGNAVDAVNNINDFIGISGTPTPFNNSIDSTSIIGAINELDNEIGNFSVINGDIFTTTAQNAREAINELDGEIGPIVFNTPSLDGASTLVEAINELDNELGNIVDIIGDLDVDADTIVGAINELKSDMGEIDTLVTDDQSSIVNAVTELHNDIGDLTALDPLITSPNRDNAVEAISYVAVATDSRLTATETATGNNTTAINNNDTDIGDMGTLYGSHTDLVSAINDANAGILDVFDPIVAAIALA